MSIVNIPLIGPTYTNRSLPVNAQVTRGFYATVNLDVGGERLSFQPFPGLKPFATGVGASRGAGTLNGVLYEVMGGSLYKISSNGSATSLGSIEGVGRCKLEEATNNLVITTGVGRPYSYDGSTLTQGTDIDLPSANTVTYINRRVVYDSSNGDVAFSDLSNPLSVNSANVIIAEAKQDDMVAVYAYKQQLLAFGTESIQPMYNSGTGNPPYAFILNATQEVGLAAAHSVSSNNKFLYFLGSDNTIYQMAGLSLRSIGNPAIGQAIAGYSSVSDAFGLCFTLDNTNFYMISFTNGDETWLYNEDAGIWTNLSFGTDGSQHLIASYNRVYGKDLVTDRRNGNVYELDFDTHTDNGDIIQRRRDTASIDGATFGKAGADIFMNSLLLEIEPGTSLVTSESQIIMQYSDDNGRSWSAERWRPIGAQGEYRHEIEWFGLGTFKRRMFRFTMTDPIKWVLIKLSADINISYG
ncbi:packaged DNA stabilization protein [uncultured Paraglaciecola sp.]|uniref:packaged DNA stabilization protein n=1 Tax=uncultured Paraglaciecola sp. TaxID=1765024 RepID=UPI0026274519|nr:packaged DNA stabilization protein [uncultured Paraglaciecola sp.]